MADSRDRTAVVFDSQPLWLDALETVLTANGIGTIWKTTDADEAAALLAEQRPDVFVTEHRRSGRGLDCLRRARAVLPDLKSIVLSDDADAAAVERAFAAGATAYIVKKARPEDFAAAIRQLFVHSVYLAPANGSGTEATAARPGRARRHETARV